MAGGVKIEVRRGIQMTLGLKESIEAKERELLTTPTNLGVWNKCSTVLWEQSVVHVNKLLLLDVFATFYIICFYLKGVT